MTIQSHDPETLKAQLELLGEEGWEIEQDVAKKITSEIKSSKMKIQAKINGNELRIDGKKRDD